MFGVEDSVTFRAISLQLHFWWLPFGGVFVGFLVGFGFVCLLLFWGFFFGGAGVFFLLLLNSVYPLSLVITHKYQLAQKNINERERSETDRQTDTRQTDGQRAESQKKDGETEGVDQAQPPPCQKISTRGRGGGGRGWGGAGGRGHLLRARLCARLRDWVVFYLRPRGGTAFLFIDVCTPATSPEFYTLFHVTDKAPSQTKHSPYKTNSPPENHINLRH